MTKVYVVTDTVEDSFAGSSTDVVGVFTTLDRAELAVVKYKKNYIKMSLDRENPEELAEELDRCVQISEAELED